MKRKSFILLIFFLIIIAWSVDRNKIISYFYKPSASPVTESTEYKKEAAVNEFLDNPFIKVDLIRVVDGDTIIVFYNEEERYVRLIGVDTPESVNPDELKNNEFGKMASDYTKEILSGYNEVYLQFDVSETDQYGRLLCYVWLFDSDNLTDMLNYQLVADGYAFHKEYEPDTYYAESFTAATVHAKDNQKGLWAYKDFENLWN